MSIHEMMIDHLIKECETYEESVAIHNSALDDQTKKFAQYLERTNRSEPSNIGLNNVELAIRSDMNVEELAFMHDWLRAQLKLVTDFLTTHHFNSRAETPDSSPDLDSKYAELQEMFRSLRALNKLGTIPNDVFNRLPIKQGKAPRSGEVIDKLNITRPRSATKQIRENSTHVTLVVDNVQMQSNLGQSIREAFITSVPEFMELAAKAMNKRIEDFSMHDLVDNEITIGGRKVYLVNNES